MTYDAACLAVLTRAAAPEIAIDCSDDSPPPVVFESAGDGELDLQYL